MANTVIHPDPLRPVKPKRNYQAQEIGRLRARVIALEGQSKMWKALARRFDRELRARRRADAALPHDEVHTVIRRQAY